MMKFKGHTVTIYFSVVNQGCSDKTNAMYVDDVSLTYQR